MTNFKARIEYVAPAVLDGGMTTVREHFKAFTTIDNTINIVCAGIDEYDVLWKLRDAIKERLTTDERTVYNSDIDITVIERLYYPEKVLTKVLKDEEQKKAREEAAAKRDQIAKEKTEQFKADFVKHCGNAEYLRYVSFDADSNQVEVCPVTRYNQYRHRNEVVFPRRRFKSTSWPRIANAIRDITQFYEEERAAQQAHTDMGSALELLKAELGIDKYSSALTHKGTTVTFFTSWDCSAQRDEKFEEIKKVVTVLRELGIKF